LEVEEFAARSVAISVGSPATREEGGGWLQGGRWGGARSGQNPGGGAAELGANGWGGSCSGEWVVGSG